MCPRASPTSRSTSATFRATRLRRSSASFVFVQIAAPDVAGAGGGVVRERVQRVPQRYPGPVRLVEGPLGPLGREVRGAERRPDPIAGGGLRPQAKAVGLVAVAVARRSSGAGGTGVGSAEPPPPPRAATHASFSKKEGREIRTVGDLQRRRARPVRTNW